LSGAAAHIGVRRALELSQRLLEAARQGELPAVVDLDAERAALLREYLHGARRVGDEEARLLQAIGRLNDESLACLEQRRRETAERLDAAKRGRRAVNAYAAVQEHHR